jgi:coproporphyrinogen III oxidase
MVLTEYLWERADFNNEPGGSGITRAFKGRVFESAGVNTSKIFGAIDPQFAETLYGDKNVSSVSACGISLILHPRSPKIPTVHANFRLLQKGDTYWFGGGADLTPFYPNVEDFMYFHEKWKSACAPYGCYEAFKDQCDQYFTNHHRGHEMRGIGGIFFDHYNSGNQAKDFEMVTALSDKFISSYFPIVEKRINDSWTEEDEDFQLHRRGRYVEFNLLHDRGTLFGLRTKGRTESILISLPARCKYSYNYAPKKDSVHEQMMQYYFAKKWV